MSYRVEIAKQGRAGCQATHCKKEGVKIAKGELRQGVLVTIMEHQNYMWRHWGCVTPEVLHNWAETCQMDMDLVDGYDDLPGDVQAKVKRALEQKHVDDDDWNGDLEMNRYVEGSTKRGMFVKTPKKKAKDDDEDESEASPVKKKATKKRGRAAEDNDAEPAPKKAKGRSKKAATEDEDVADPEDAPKQPAKRGRKAKDSVVDEAEPAPAKKAAKGKKAKSAPKVDSDTIGEDEPAPPKKTRTKKLAAAPTNEDDEVPDTTAAPPKKRKGRAKKAAAEEA